MFVAQYCCFGVESEPGEVFEWFKDLGVDFMLEVVVKLPHVSVEIVDCNKALI